MTLRKNASLYEIIVVRKNMDTIIQNLFIHIYKTELT